MPTGKKIQVLKDRFDRPWYAVAQNETGEHREKIIEEQPQDEDRIEQVENLPITDIQTPSQSGGVVTENNGEEQLISWDKADELGLKLPDKASQITNNFDSDFKPIDEIH
jgi:hypothetical protein